jgi:hypothetical protein
MRASVALSVELSRNRRTLCLQWSLRSRGPRLNGPSSPIGGPGPERFGEDRRLRRLPHGPACRRRRASRSEGADHRRPRDRRADRCDRSRGRGSEDGRSRRRSLAGPHLRRLPLLHKRSRESLRSSFTGYTRDGGFATTTIADTRYAFPLGGGGRRRWLPCSAPASSAGAP